MLKILHRICWIAAALGSRLASADAPVYQIDVLASFPHDPQAFTQGLVIANGQLYEGTGRNGLSMLRRVNLETGEVQQRQSLSARYFGEGITILDGKVYQLTWQSHLGFVYDLATFKLEKTFFYSGEGWGITHDGSRLIVSDGTANLRFFDPDTLKETGSVPVTEEGRAVDRLNELEYINGEVWANVWYTDQIVRIDPQTGEIRSRIDLSGLNQQRGVDDVLNGIAWDNETGRLFVTGKLWSTLYEIKLRE
jgi:glutamine cyclotransferase